MAYLGIILLFILGYVFTRSFLSENRLGLNVGLAFPMGLGLLSIIMFLYDLLGIPVNSMAVLYVTMFFLIAGFIALLKQKKQLTFSLSLIMPAKKDMLRVNLAWVMLMLASTVLIITVVGKALFWPVFIYDSIAGYDFIAKLIASEGTLNNSIFNPEYPLYSVRSLYPPLVPYAFGFAYSAGFENSKVIVVLFYLSIFTVFYTLIKQEIGHLGAAFFSLLLASAPEFAGFSALSSPNPPSTFYSAMGLLLVFNWYDGKDKSYLYLGWILLIFALWTRSETIIFAAMAGIFILLNAFKDKRWYLPVFYAVSTLGTLVVWQLYLNFILNITAAQPIMTYIYWDGAKLLRMLEQVLAVTFNTRFYGVIVYLFIALVILNIYSIIKKGDRGSVLLLIFIPWVLYMFIYYQIDTDYMPGSVAWIGAGYKRGFFYFLPLLLFYSATNSLVRSLFTRWLLLK